MSEEPERPSAGHDEAKSLDLGEPEREGNGEEHAEARPNLDERHDRIRTQRKPMGPPLAEPEEPEALQEDFDADGRVAEERPVDPD